VDIRVAAGEQDTTVWGFRELIERGHVDLVQPDVTRCGGITELLRIGALARERGVETVPHAWKSGIIKAASLHVNAVLPDALFQEYCVAETPINQTLTKERLALDAEGFVAVPTGPGLGIELDEDVLERYRVA
jgi:L-rhamnonate dehydratase